jgi:HAMP domain-containing protein
MKNLFQKIKKIKTKFLIQYGILITLSILLMVVMIFSIQKIANYTHFKNQTQELKISLLEMRKAEKDFELHDLINESFYESGATENINTIKLLKDSIHDNIGNLLNNKELIHALNLRDTLVNAQLLVSEYNQTFLKLKEKHLLKGYKDWGVEGKLRESIHKIEKGNVPFDKVTILTLRRAEKDFFLRKDLEYVDKFDASILDFKTTLNNDYKSSLLPLINNYQAAFHQIVSIEKEIGLTAESGIRAELQSITKQTEPLINRVQNDVSKHVENIIQSTIVFLIVLFLIQLVIAIYLAISFSNATTKSIQSIKNGISTLSDGEFPEKIETHNQDEIGQTSNAFNNLIDRIKTASVFAEKIGKGELEIEYDEHFNNDVLAISLQNMHDKLVQVNLDNEKRNWINEGLTKFVDITRDTKNIERFYNNILSNIIKYVGANQGYLYVINDENKYDVFMEVKSVYAYGKERYLEEKKIIRYKEGLVGQAWFDKECLIFTEIPGDYVRITSGMGEATPRCIFICPLIINELIVGVIEIASFKILEEYKMEFIQKIAETIASTVSTVKTNDLTATLLEQSLQQTEEMRAQEEEIRQNMEEMNATQDEMTRKEIDMVRRMNELEKENNLLKEENLILNQKINEKLQINKNSKQYAKEDSLGA